MRCLRGEMNVRVAGTDEEEHADHEVDVRVLVAKLWASMFQSE
jgi:hypothetical protein